jgi:NADPH:quinone reductase-like Zn-dependent oxidoreductase
MPAPLETLRSRATRCVLAGTPYPLLRPVVDERMFPLEQAAQAIDYLALGAAKGRVVLTV